MYFEGPPIHQGGKPRRKVIYYVNRSIEQYNPEDIPPMWRAWLTHTRNTELPFLCSNRLTAPLIQVAALSISFDE
ncbi:hypothetical protein BJ742DRAFT_792510 [Cladochytrium replicatum]|nr:hypothetical protein BJ742DRAFT_792510 [Cladochytrium replicatum]